VTTVERLNNTFSDIHCQYFGIGTRNDKINISSLLHQFIQSHTSHIQAYSTLDEYIEQEFKVFCIGYCEYANEDAKSQNCPLKWGLDQYDYYLECGQKYNQNKKEINTDKLIYKVLPNEERDVILEKGVNLYTSLVQEARSVLSPKIYDHYFDQSVFSLIGVETTFRLMIQSPYKNENIVKGELYKYLYSLVFPQLGKELSVRLI